MTFHISKYFKNIWWLLTAPLWCKKLRAQPFCTRYASDYGCHTIYCTMLTLCLRTYALMLLKYEMPGCSFHEIWSICFSFLGTPTYIWMAIFSDVCEVGIFSFWHSKHRTGCTHTKLTSSCVKMQETLVSHLEERHAECSRKQIWMKQAFILLVGVCLPPIDIPKNEVSKYLHLSLIFSSCYASTIHR